MQGSQLDDQFTLEDKTNTVIFKNKGTINCIVNGDILEPGESISLEGWAGEEDKSSYSLSFVGASGGVISIWWKKYIN